MRLLDHYIRDTVIGSTLLVVLVVLGLESFMEFVNQLSNIGKGHFGVLQAFIYVPLQLPTDLYQLFPMAGFLGCLIGLGRLASSSQLTVMRAAGVSVRRIAWSVVKAALVMIVVVTLVGEIFAPKMQDYAKAMQLKALGKSAQENLSGVWLRHDDTFIHVGNMVNTHKLQNIYLFDFNDQHQLKSMQYSKLAVLQNQHWQLQDNTVTRLQANHSVVEKIGSRTLPVNFEPQLIQPQKSAAEQDGIMDLLKNIWYRRKAGLITNLYEFSLWRRIIQPLTTVVMICLGVPFIFGSLRSVSMGVRVVTGVIVGFAFYMLNQFFGPITMVYQFPPWIAATLPTLLFMIIYVVLLRKTF